jgi:formiminotetrahydrofolate cyclodeaminase
VCADALKLMETVAGAGNRAATADLLVAIGIVRAAADGAAANVRANLDTLDDHAFTASAMQRLTATLEDASQSAHNAFGALQG